MTLHALNVTRKCKEISEKIKLMHYPGGDWMEELKARIARLEKTLKVLRIYFEDLSEGERITKSSADGCITRIDENLANTYHRPG